MRKRESEWERDFSSFKAPIYSATKLLYDKLYVFIKLSFVRFLLLGTIPTSSFNWNLLFSSKQFFTVNIVYKSGVDSPKNQINNQNVNKKKKFIKNVYFRLFDFVFQVLFVSFWLQLRNGTFHCLFITIVRKNYVYCFDEKLIEI